MKEEISSRKSFKDVNIILDIDYTLIHTEKITSNEVAITKRPGLEYLYEFCLRKCKTVSLWTAGEKGWLDIVVESVFQANYFYRMLHKDHCVKIQTTSVDLENVNMTEESWDMVGDYFYLKDLSLLWNLDKSFDKTNTIIVDDFSLGLYKTPENLYPILKYKGDHDSELYRLCCWIEHYNSIGFDDVREIPKSI